MMNAGNSSGNTRVCCPKCGATQVIERTDAVGVVTCNRCRHLVPYVWLPAVGEMSQEGDSSELDRLVAEVANRLGVTRYELEAGPVVLSQRFADSLDLVELIMELEAIQNGR